MWYVPQAAERVENLTAADDVALAAFARGTDATTAWSSCDAEVTRVGLPPGTGHNLAE